MTDIFTGTSENHIELINELRLLLSDEISSILTNHDILRFLRARNGSIQRANEMIIKWFEWRHTLLDPLPPHGLRLSPNVILASPMTLDQHPSKSLLPVTHEGFSKLGHPIYWEKTGYIQSTFPEVKKNFTNIELLQYHIMSNELVECRLLYASKKFNHQVDKMIVVFDMSHVQVTLDMDSIWYIKQILQVDQNYYPERLYKLYIINSPWYFPALYGMFKPFIDARTRDKINIFSTNYLSAMLEVIDITEIPTEYGGEKVVRWDMMWDDETGASRKQAEEFFYERLTTTLKNKLTEEEVLVLKQGLIMGGRIPQAIGIIEQLIQKAEAEGKITEIPQLKDEIQRLKIQQYNQITLANGTNSLNNNQNNNNQNNNITTLQINESNHHHHHNNNHHIIDDEIVSISSTPTVSTVQMSHLSDILSIQINDIEKHSNYFTYVLTVHCRRNESWKIHRRYSQFYKFRKFISRVNPKVRSIPFPPKKYFFNNSLSVVRYRQRILQDFFNQILKLCEGFDTPEQDIIFRFIDGNDHVSNPIRDTLSVGVWTDASTHHTSSLPGYQHITQSVNNGNNNSKNNALYLTSKNNPNNRPLSLSVYDQRIWSTPIAAAVLSCCLLVISIMSQIQASEHIPVD